MVNIVLLGCGGNVPTPTRNLSSLFIDYRGRGILIDCGEGTQVSMKMAKTGFKNIDLICITHLHADHTIGIIGLLSSMGNSDRRDPVTIIGPNGIRNLIKASLVINDGVPFELRVIENPIGKMCIYDDNLKDIEIDVLPLEHSKECLGYSFYFKRQRKFNREKAEANEVPKFLWNNLQKNMTYFYNNRYFTPEMVLGEERNGIKLSFITDTRPIDSIPEFIKGSDLFVCEGMYGDDMDISKAVKNKHMTFRESATLAKRGGVKKLLLTHFSPSLTDPEEFIENASSVFANTIIGENRLELVLSYPEEKSDWFILQYISTNKK